MVFKKAVLPEADVLVEVPLLDLEPVHRPIRRELKEAVIRVLESNRFIGGPEIENFESEMAEYCEVPHAVGVSSGTDALVVTLMALGVGYGDEVIVPSFTFFSTAGSVRRLGAVPIFCDIEPRGFNLDPDELPKLITPRTRAVIPVHLFGQCADMDPILDICRRYSLRVIEDAAQAVGARYRGKMAGSMGDTGCFSFFPSKNLGGIGDGGLVTTKDTVLADKIRSLREHGAERRYYHSSVGGNFRLDAIQAAALRVKLRHVEAWHEQRRLNAAAYAEALSDLHAKGLVRLPEELDDRRHVFNQFVIRVAARDSLQKYLTEHRVGTAVYYPVPLHMQDCFSDLKKARGGLPESEAAAGQVLALPVFPGLSEAQRETVIHHVRAYFSDARAGG
jgi:dTDP-4-amino-4,6-dideoxygalactose transaminase